MSEKTCDCLDPWHEHFGFTWAAGDGSRHYPEAEPGERLYPGDCGDLHGDRWCTRLRGHAGQHISENPRLMTVTW